MGGSNCAVHSCYFGKPRKHRFPNPKKDMQRFKKWISLVGNKELLEKAPEKVYENCRVCGDHFLESDLGPNNVLLKTALPSLKLPDPLYIEEFPQTEVSMQLREQCAVKISTEAPVESVASPINVNEIRDVTGLFPIIKDPTIAGPSRVNEIGEDTDLPPIMEEPIAGPSGVKQYLLKEVNVTRKVDLTPKAKHFYEKSCKLKRRINVLESSKKSLKKKLFSKEALASNKPISSMDRIRKRFFDSQIENLNRKPRGRRFTLEDKVLALALYKHSGATYKFMSKMFTLPSRRTLTTLLHKIPTKPGLNEEIFSLLAAEVKNLSDPKDKICTLIFDEMSIQPGLAVNKSEGTIIGFENYGYRTSDQIANHVQVYMLRGIRKKWKQPVYYNFCAGATKFVEIKRIIRDIIVRCSDIGLKVVATVCDQGSNNVAAINSLIKERKEKFLRQGVSVNEKIFEINGHEVVPLYDIPHLFKGVRNNFLKYDIEFDMEGEKKVAKWRHIKTMYEMDSFFGGLRMCKDLTDKHIYPRFINKMKVSLCTQVLSHSVAVGINVMAQSGMLIQNGGETLKLEPEAIDTASFISLMDSLFDSLNGSKFQSKKVLRRAVRKNSPHLQFWDEAQIILRSMKCRKNGSLFTPPSFKNLVTTISNFKIVFKKLTDLKFEYMMPRTFNQDPLENFFGQIRQRGHRLVNPSAETFISAYKSLVVKNLTSAHSFSANCEDDESEIFVTLQRLVSQDVIQEEEDDDEYSPVPEDLPSRQVPLERKILKYISGYLLKKNQSDDINNCFCTKIFLLRENDSDFKDDEFTREKEYDKSKSSLFYVNKEFSEKMSRAYAIMKYVMSVDLHKKKVLKHLLRLMKSRIRLTSCEHNELLSTKIFRYFIHLNIYHYVRQINNVIKGDVRHVPKNCCKYFKSARNMYIKSCKYKK